MSTVSNQASNYNRRASIASNDILNRHNANFHIESEIGKGSKFLVTFQTNSPNLLQ